MKITALITALVLGSSSLVLADPIVRDHRDHDDAYTPAAQPIVRDHRDESFAPSYTQAPVAQPIVRDHRHLVWQPQLVTLASNARLAKSGRTFIQVSPTAGRFRTLEIKGDTGRVKINQVAIRFANGQEQVVRDLDRVIDNDDTIKIDLAGNLRAITGLVVYGQSVGGRWVRGSFDVLAS